jgi:hypothetical protein
MIPGEAPNQIARLDDLLGVEAGGRLVENQHVRVVNQRLRQPDALPVPLGEPPAVPVRHVGDPRALHHGRDALLALARRDTLDLGHEVQVLAHAHVGIERRRFREVAGPPLGVEGMIEHVEAGHHRASLGRRHVTGQDPHGRRFSGAVGPQKAENLPFFDAKADVVHRSEPAVSLRDVLNLDHTVAPFIGTSARASSPRLEAAAAPLRPRARCRVCNV